MNFTYCRRVYMAYKKEKSKRKLVLQTDTAQRAVRQRAVQPAVFWTAGCQRAFLTAQGF